MDRFTWMAIRMMLPAMFLVAGGITVTWILPDSTSTPLLAGVLERVRWLPLLLALAAALWSVWVGFRLWQWHRGNALVCKCGGLLGGEREGRFGPYRRCLACGQPTAQRHYATG